MRSTIVATDLITVSDSNMRLFVRKETFRICVPTRVFKLGGRRIQGKVTSSTCKIALQYEILENMSLEWRQDIKSNMQPTYSLWKIFAEFSFTICFCAALSQNIVLFWCQFFSPFLIGQLERVIFAHHCLIAHFEKWFDDGHNSLQQIEKKENVEDWAVGFEFRIRLNFLFLTEIVLSCIVIVMLLFVVISSLVVCLVLYNLF